MPFNPGDKVKIGLANPNEGIAQPLAISNSPDGTGVVIRTNESGRIYVKHDASQSVVRWEERFLTLIP